MRRIGFLFNQICSRENFRHAWLKAIRGKSQKAEVLDFYTDVDANLERLRFQVASGTFAIGKYHYFTIHDPKERIICAASFPERIVHHALMNILDPYFEKRQIADSFACRRSKGTQAAVLKAFAHARRYPFFLKMDVRKYFDTIDHSILKKLYRRFLKDPQVLSLLDAIVESYETAPGKGIPIGNLTSQYFANEYLSVFDHFAKEKLRLVPWIRYMDDILVFGSDPRSLAQAYGLLATYCSDRLLLALKAPIINRTKSGAPFLGFSIPPRLVDCPYRQAEGRGGFFRQRRFTGHQDVGAQSANQRCNRSMTASRAPSSPLPGVVRFNVGTMA